MKYQITGCTTSGTIFSRWKGENVSTVEVSNVLTDVEWIEDANVYGVQVPGVCVCVHMEMKM